MQATKQSTNGITVTPKACARATLSGFNSTVLATAPAAAVTFRVGSNGVSEVLVAPSGAAAAGRRTRTPRSRWLSGRGTRVEMRD